MDSLFGGDMAMNCSACDSWNSAGFTSTLIIKQRQQIVEPSLQPVIDATAPFTFIPSSVNGISIAACHVASAIMVARNRAIWSHSRLVWRGMNGEGKGQTESAIKWNP